MRKQKICIIGGGLTGLITAISLSKLNCDIDLIAGNINRNIKSNRTIAISQNNFDFIKKLNISKSIEKESWACSKMKLYAETKNKKFSEIFELNNDNKSKKILYMLENSNMMKHMINKIKHTKSISIKTHATASEITTSGLLQSVKYKNNKYNYNLIIICTGNNSDLVKNLFSEKFIKNSYGETSITAILNHASLNNNTVRQIFLDDEILALLPISNTKTSIVWSVKKDIYKKNDLLAKKKIKFYTKNYLKKTKFLNKIEYKDLNFLIRNKYYQNRTLLFGDVIHLVHPLVGQGFNMTLRDLSSLQRMLSDKMNLGLDIGCSNILSEFSDKIKPRNFVYAMSINFLKDFFSLKNQTYKKLRNNTLKVLNKNSFAKDIFFNLADEGFKF